MSVSYLLNMIWQDMLFPIDVPVRQANHIIIDEKEFVLIIVNLRLRGEHSQSLVILHDLSLYQSFCLVELVCE